MKKSPSYSDIVTHVTKEETHNILNDNYNEYELFVLRQKILNRDRENTTIIMTLDQINKFYEIGNNIDNQKKYLNPILIELTELYEYQSNEYEQDRINDYFPEMFRPGLN